MHSKRVPWKKASVVSDFMLQEASINVGVIGLHQGEGRTGEQAQTSKRVQPYAPHESGPWEAETRPQSPACKSTAASPCFLLTCRIRWQHGDIHIETDSEVKKEKCWIRQPICCFDSMTTQSRNNSCVCISPTEQKPLDMTRTMKPKVSRDDSQVQG